MSDISYTGRMSWQYLAAFTDADGTITVYPRKTGTGIECRVVWSQAEQNSWVLVEITRFLDSHRVHWAAREMKSSQWSNREQPMIDVYRHADVLFILEQMRPYFILKEDLAEKAIELLHSRKAHGSVILRDEIHTHCKNGHEWKEENTYHFGGSRQCRACRRESMRQYRIRRAV